MNRQTIYLLRHGETAGDGERRLIGQTDLPLGDRGIGQARCWASQLPHWGVSTVYASDLRRSVETATIIAQRLGTAVQMESRLREIDLGAWDGLTKAEILARFPEQWRQRGEDLENFRPQGGESFADLRERVVPVFCRILSNARRPLVVVGHAGVNRVILCHVLAMPLCNLFRIGQDFAALNIIECVDGSFRVAALNCRSLPRAV